MQRCVLSPKHCGLQKNGSKILNHGPLQYPSIDVACGTTKLWKLKSGEETRDIYLKTLDRILFLELPRHSTVPKENYSDINEKKDLPSMEPLL